MAGVLAAGAGMGCDDKSEVPPEVIRAKEQQEREQRQAALPATKPTPTTQQLMAEERRPLKLGSFPLMVDAPKSWTIGSLGGSGDIITLKGPATSGEIVIQFVERNQVVNDVTIDVRLEEAKREAASKPYPVNRATLRPFGPGKLLEQRVIASPFENGKPPVEVWGEVDTGIKDARTQANLMTRGILKPCILKWNFTLFTPVDKQKSLVRGLNFMSLRLAEYEQDKEFLEQLMGSLRYQE
jgi:hypothetical protein